MPSLTLHQLFDLRTSSSLRNRTAAACWRAAQAVFSEDPQAANHTNRLAWARRVLEDDGEGAEVLRVFRALLSSEAVQAAGEAATDAEIQTAVDTLVTVLAGSEP
jgi:hypothetical protein